MGLEIKGEFTEEETAFVENDGPSAFSVMVTTPADKEKYGDEVGAYYERGNRAIGSAISLLKLLEPLKGEQLETLTEEIMQPKNEVEQGMYQMTREKVKRLYELIKEMPDQWSKICDWKWALQPPFDETVEQIDRTLYRIESGEKLIDMSAGQVEQLIKFLELAIKKQRDVWLSY